MKHYITDEDIELVIKGANEIGLEIDGARAELLCRHLVLVLEANETTNLTRITDWTDGLRLHVLDSLLCAKELAAAPQGAFLDLGTGAGFPGIPAGCAAGRNGTLLDSVKKKAVLVAQMVEELGLAAQLRVCSERAEEHASQGNRYSAVLARAVSSIPALVELSSPLLPIGGDLIALKGRLDENELSRGAAAGERVGMRKLSVRSTTVPFGAEVRTIVVFRKVAESSIRLPRRPGLAQHSPLV